MTNLAVFSSARSGSELMNSAVNYLQAVLATRQIYISLTFSVLVFLTVLHSCKRRVFKMQRLFLKFGSNGVLAVLLF